MLPCSITLGETEDLTVNDPVVPDPGSASSFVVLDVGGTTLAAAAVAPDGERSAVIGADSPVDADAAEIVAVLADLVGRATPPAASVAGLVVCAPGPFDYERGVSLMRHKFAALYNVDLQAALREATGLNVLFLNDAEAAAIGVWASLSDRPPRMAVVTLGTGVGAALLHHGVPVEDLRDDELWCRPYLDGLFEDRVSSAAIRQGYHGRSGREVEVREIAFLAADGDQGALDTFEDFATHLGTGLARYFEPHGVSQIVVAGGVSAAWPLFGPRLETAYGRAGGAARLAAADVDLPALHGGAIAGQRHLTSG